MKHLISVPPGVESHFYDITGLKREDWFAGCDPEHKRVGSGGGTAWMLTELWKKEQNLPFGQWLQQEQRMIIHAGGKSRRLPSYAPAGKSLMPMPVFRWSRGQDLNQRLINLQTPLFDSILKKAPRNLNTLIASGDTLIFGGKNITEIPDADVVCFGLWLEPEKASNHGVFFARIDKPTDLEFMLQKPDVGTIRNLVSDYFFLMDIGIWLMSPRAIALLMERCGWEKDSYHNSIPDEYDLYSDFGMALGSAPVKADDQIAGLTVALVNLEGGEFYHLGNTSELITSNLAIQNRIHDQREIWHKDIKPHPSIFVLNSITGINFHQNQRNIWIENSYIPETWTLGSDHALTGIPFNKWVLNLSRGNCLDLVPLNDEQAVIRNYGFFDKFDRSAGLQGSFMNMSLREWLSQHHLDADDLEFPEDADLQMLPLFPVVDRKGIDSSFIQWLLDVAPERNQVYADLWKSSLRLSADELNKKADISSIEKQRMAFHAENLELLARNYHRSVFYQLDLEKVSDEYVKLGLALPPELNVTDNQGWIPVHDHMFRAALLRKRGEDFTAYETKAFSYLREHVLDHFYEHRVDPVIQLLPDQIAWGRSPIRLDLAGGWTDTPPYCMLYGGKVLNVAVELNGQPPLHCYIKATSRPAVVLRSIDLGAQEVIEDYEGLRSFTDIGSAFSIPKAALALTGFLPEFSVRKFTSLEQQLQEAGGGLEISILAAIPKGSGLGTSSILAATVIGTLAEVCCLGWDKAEVGKRTLALEQLLTTGGGWQDQYGGLYEGIKFLETTPGKLQVPMVKWLPDSLFTDILPKNRMLLYYTGITRVAKNILADIVRGMFLNSASHLAILDELKNHASATYETILRKDYTGLGNQIRKSWELNQSLDSGTNTPEIQSMIDRISPYIIGQKLLGAGGGGFMLILARDEEAALRIKNVLNENPVTPNARFVDFRISESGFKVTKS